MKIHEYQAKAILSRYGVTTPRGEVAFTKEEAREAAQRLKSNIVVVKAQIHAGGRGKAGGVKLARSADEAADIAGQILGMNLVTPQTGPAGRIVKRLLIEEGLDIKRELYLGLLVDRVSQVTKVPVESVAPVPEEENAYLSGFARSRAMNSFAFAAGKEGFVTRAKGVSAIRLTGEKSFIGSYGTFCRLGMMESGPLDAASSV